MRSLLFSGFVVAGLLLVGCEPAESPKAATPSVKVEEGEAIPAPGSETPKTNTPAAETPAAPAAETPAEPAAEAPAAEAPATTPESGGEAPEGGN